MLLEKKLSGFDRPDALLEGVESRTSSPVRIVREPKKLTSNIEGIYPAERAPVTPEALHPQRWTGSRWQKQSLPFMPCL